MSWFRSRVSRPGDLYCRALRIPWRFLSCEFRSFLGGNVLECRGIDIAKCVVTMIGMAARRKSDGVTSLSERANRCEPCHVNLLFISVRMGSSCGAESANPGWILPRASLREDARPEDNEPARFTERGSDRTGASNDDRSHFSPILRARVA